MKKTIACVSLAASMSVFSPSYASGSLSEASAVSVLVTGSVVLLVSTLPLVALDSMFDGSVGKVKPAPNKMTDIEVKPKNGDKVAVIRVPDQALTGKSIQTGQKAELIADKSGHTLKIEDKPIAYLPGKDADGLLHSTPVN
jgi:hypothetical protein